MATLEQIIPGASVIGLVPGTSVTIVRTQWHGSSTLEVNYRLDNGTVEEKLLYRSDEPLLEVSERSRSWAFDAPGDLFRLASEAQRISLAAIFDPVMAVHTSLVRPLPHQILAVYESLLPRQPLRFLLADDPGAGKTIMAGLLIKEMLARGDLERCLIVAPGSLVEQWQDELLQKFHLHFQIATNDNLEASATRNWFQESPLAIARLDKLSRNPDIQEKLRAANWDLIVVDEAHKMSATFFSGEAKYTKRFHLGRLLSEQCRHFLLMTATPHNGKEEDFHLFMSLLDGDRFEGRPRDSVHTTDCSDMMRRLVKEQLLKFDGTPLFPERRAYTAGYELTGIEAELYANVTDYVRQEFNRAERESGAKRGTVGFALTVLQRRLASSPEAIYQSLRRRRERLESLLTEVQLLERGGRSTLLDRLRQSKYSEEDIEDLDQLDEISAQELEAAEEEISAETTAATNPEELQVEISILKRLEGQAMAVKRSGLDRKWDELARLLQSTPEMFNSDGTRRKLIIFTEHKDTLQYLRDRIATLLGKPESIVVITGGMGRDQRKNAEEAFKFDKDVEIMLATDAAGEGINLQRAHLMVNYDLPWNPNRIEQRFGRIHRIGQTEVCHLWNMVATETREGEVFKRLLDKLEIQRAALGGRVFDVLGMLFQGQPLRELLVEAIRYGDSPEIKAKLYEAVDNSLDRKRVQEAVEYDVVARDAFDGRTVQRVREEMELADARRLQPHYVQAFFLDAFRRFGGQIAERESKRFEITRVPSILRERDRVIGVGAPVRPKYERVTFEKDAIDVQGKPTAAFICPGHPLLEVLIDRVLELHRQTLRRGAILIDPHNRTEVPRLLFYLEHSIKDGVRNRTGEARTISREVHFVEITQDGEFSNPGYAPYLDYQPATEDEISAAQSTLQQGWISDEPDKQATSFAVQHVVPQHIERVRKDRIERIERAQKAIKHRLTQEIAYWDSRAVDLQAREDAGRTAKLNSTIARNKADELEARLRSRLEKLELERHISASLPVVTGGALVVPQVYLDRLQGRDPSEISTGDRDRIDRLAIAAVLEAERSLGRIPEEMHHSNPGYDILSRDPKEPGRLRFIEVKGKAVGRTTVTISATQIRTCLNKPDDWILAIVPIDGDRAQQPRYVRQPFSTLPDFAEVGRNLDLEILFAAATDPI